MSIVQFTSLGSVGEVGASAHLLHIDGLDILLDCGLHPKKDGLDSLPEFSRLRRAPDAVIVSHAHHDHCGSLPYFLREYPSTTPYAPVATVAIMDRMLHNSVSVMGKLREEKGISEYPLYHHRDVENAVRRTYGIDMYQTFGLSPKSLVRVTFYPAGHVLGSASIHIVGPEHSVFYTSDICTSDQMLMQGFTLPENARNVDTLIIESTYGANEEADTVSYRDEIQRFGSDMARILDDGGTVLVPSFALGRAQEMLNIVADMQHAGVLPDVPVYASGLGRAVYEIYHQHRDQLRPGATLVPLTAFDSVGDVWDPDVANRLIESPCIIVATSGMMIENTPSAMIAQALVRHPHHAIFFVGYCDSDTLGHLVKHAQPGDALCFERGAARVKVNTKNIASYQFSAHAPRKDLKKIADQFEVKNMIFVHGDPPALDWMHEHCGNGCLKYTPAIGETIRLEG
ncbi:MAG: MBL fold metallo-hydrolase [Candidatus Hydrogenedentes bacterium]|nr:MBL fold metallo-hydrolase [Candidatus Hydrogenedentota bacterium]